MVKFPTVGRCKQLPSHLRNCVCLAQWGPADMIWECEPRILKRSAEQGLGGWVEMLKRHCVLTRYVPISSDTSLASESTYEPRATSHEVSWCRATTRGRVGEGNSRPGTSWLDGQTANPSHPLTA